MAQSRVPSVTVEPRQAEALVREHLAELAEAAHELVSETRGLLDFVPPEVNPIVVARGRVAGVVAAGERLLAIVNAPSLATTTADVGPGELEQR